MRGFSVRWQLFALKIGCLSRQLNYPKPQLIRVITKQILRFKIRYAIYLPKGYRETQRYAEAYEIYQESESQLWAKNAIREIAKELKLYEKYIPEQLKKVEMNPNDPELIGLLLKVMKPQIRLKKQLSSMKNLLYCNLKIVYGIAVGGSVSKS